MSKPVQLKLTEPGEYPLYVNGEWEDSALNIETGQTMVHWFIDEFIEGKAFFHPTHPWIEHEIELVVDCYS